MKRLVRHSGMVQPTDEKSWVDVVSRMVGQMNSDIENSKLISMCYDAARREFIELVIDPKSAVMSLEDNDDEGCPQVSMDLTTFLSEVEDRAYESSDEVDFSLKMRDYFEYIDDVLRGRVED